MAQSFFRYNLSRRFPFGWFTYAVVIGGLLLLVLFSALNFSANAYELKVVYTNDPNATLAESDRETRWPISLMGKVRLCLYLFDVEQSSFLVLTHCSAA
jgi:hypothetical protein